MIYHFLAFRNVEVQPYNLTWSNNHPQYRKCEFCGQDALNILFRQSNMTDFRMEQNVCEKHSLIATGSLFQTEKRISVEFWEAYSNAYYKALSIEKTVDSQKLFDTMAAQFNGTVYLTD